jgi:hypothetical protein
MQQYITNGYSHQIQSQSQFNEEFLQEFCQFFSKTECLEISFARAGGIKYGFGFEWAKLKILQYYQRHLKNPLTESGIFYFFKRNCKKGVLQQYGISCWWDLLEISLNDHTYYNRDRQSFKGLSGLQRAKKHLQKQYKINGKIPLSYDAGCKLIANAVRRNTWAEFGITTWGDLIFETFGLVKGQMYLWKGGSGFNRAISWIKDYVNEHGILPSGKNSDHYDSIRRVVNSKCWIKYGINTIDDLTLKACGMIAEKKRDWSGISGLEKAKNELKKYYRDHQKLPIVAKFQNILWAISYGYWKEQNIQSWNDLLMGTFGKINQAHGNWIGQKGLERARKELKEYYNIHQKLPSKGHFSNIGRAIRNGYWKEQNIESWNDLLRDTFGRINRNHDTWEGNAELNHAKKFLRRFNKKNKKYPIDEGLLGNRIKMSKNK